MNTRFNPFYKLFLWVALMLGFFAFQTAHAQIPIEVYDIAVDSSDDTEAVVTFKTNVPVSVRIDFGTTVAYDRYIQAGYGKKTEHSVLLTGLKQNTLYHYKIYLAGNEGFESTYDRTFVTGKDTGTEGQPVISNVKLVYITGTSVTVQFETDEETKGAILVGNTKQYTASRSGGYGTVHDITIGGLNNYTVYHWTVQASDRDGNLVQYQDGTFRTALFSDAEKTDLVFSNVRPLSQTDSVITDTSATISWSTNKLATGVVSYGGSTRLTAKVSQTSPRSFDHSVSIGALQPNTVYYFAIGSTDVFGRSKSTELLSFKTKPAGYSSVTLKPVPDSGMTFLARFNSAVDASSAVGKREPVKTYGSVSIEKTGRGGGSVYIGQNGMIEYEGAGNFNINKGTVAFWLRPGWNQKEVVLREFFRLNPYARSANDKTFSIIKYDTAYGLDGPVVFGIENSRDDDSLIIIPEEIFRNGQWTHVTFTWEYGGNAIAYIDGREVGSAAVSGVAPNLGSKFYLGNERNNASAYFDEFVIYDRPLEAAEISSLIQDGPESLERAVSVLGVALPEYTAATALYKTASDPTVYAILNNRKYAIPNEESFVRYGYSWSDIEVVSQSRLNSIPRARLIKSEQTGKIYHVYERVGTDIVIYLSSPQIFESYAGNSWGSIVTVDESDIQLLRQARVVKQEGTDTVYELVSGGKRPIQSPEALYRLGLNFEDVVLVSKNHLDSFVTKAPIY